MFPWGPIYLGESYTFDPRELISRFMQFVTVGIVPSIIFAIGIVGCRLTNRNAIRGEKVSKTARTLTQISVTATLFPAISAGVASIMQGISRWIYFLLYEGGYFYFNISISALCILPFALFLAYISYDFPRFRALDFKQEVTDLKRAPEEQKFPTMQ